MSRDDLFSQLRARRDGVAVAMRDAMLAQVPGYARWPGSRTPRLLDEIHFALGRALDLCPDDAANTDSDLEHFAAVGQSRAEDPLFVKDLQAGFQVSYLAGLQYCLSLAGPGDHGDLMQFNAWGAREVPRALHVATTAFSAARRHVGDSKPARQLLAERLIQGMAVGDAAAAAGVMLPQGYLVLLCEVQHPLDLANSAQLTAVENCLKSVPGALWLGKLGKDRLLILLPTDGDATSAAAVATELTAAIAEIVDQVVYAAQANGADPAAVPEAVKEAQQVIALVAAMPDVACRPYRIEELLVELAVMRQPALRQGLADLLAPLSNGTDLQHTLEVLFSCGMDRERSARALYIHRRTLTYRLGRIREKTGIDPTSPHGIQLLRTALTASRLPAPDMPE